MTNVVIIGAGPAGLAAGDTLAACGIRPLVLERQDSVGGLSRTLEYKGFRFDIGSHRFFTKNQQVFSWWKDLLGEDFRLTPRHTRIYYNGAFFRYPLSLGNVLATLGPAQALPIILSYMKSRAFPHPSEHSFEKWVSNRFGKRLYRIFFKEYTEKVWGISCDRISSDWAAQRIKGLSLSSAVRNAFFRGRDGIIKTLIHEFHYPRLGAGMMYEKASLRMQHNGASVVCGVEARTVYHRLGRIEEVEYTALPSGAATRVAADAVCSSMPLPALIRSLNPLPPHDVLEAAKKLRFRSLVMVYLILDCAHVFADNWIYVNSNDVRMGRISNYKNWSQDMVADTTKTSLGVEYFCTEGDDVWRTSDQDLIALARNELAQLRLVPHVDVVDGFVVRVPGAYPMYEHGYAQALDAVKSYIAGFRNLHCIGRAGMFRYNNMDHSILTGLMCAGNITGGRRADVWRVNVDNAYHEELEGN